MRVLLLSHVFPRSVSDTAAPFLLRHARGLVAAGADVRAVAPHDAGLPDRQELDGIPVVRARYAPDDEETLAHRGEMHRRARTPGGARKAVALVESMVRSARAEIQAWSPDVLQVHWLIPGGLVTRRLRPGVPCEVVVHGTDVALASKGPVGRCVGRWLLGAFDSVVAVSEPLGDDLTRATRRGIDEVMPMPYADPVRPPGPPPGRDVVLAVGRLVPEKGHRDLLEAVALLRRTRPGARLVLVGEGPAAAELRDRAEALGVPLRADGAVAADRLDDVYGAADVVAVPSHREGFGLVAAEALVRERPVVAADVGGLRVLVAPGKTGWRVPPRDPPALAAALEEALSAPEEARRRARAGAEEVRRRWSAEALGRRHVARLEALRSGAG